MTVNIATAPVIDLLAAAEELQADFPTISRKIKRLSDCHSIKVDLDIALDMIALCPAASRAHDAGLEWAQHASMAMMHSAVVFYVRATKSKSDHRGTLDLRAKFSGDQRNFHDQLVALRDDAVAHFGPGPLPSGFTFHDEKLVLPIDRQDGSSVMMVSRRTAFAPDFIAGFRNHLSRALILVQREIQKREADALQELTDNPERDSVEAILRKHVTTAAAAMGRADAPGVFLSGGRQGSQTVIQSDAGWIEMRRS